MPSEVGAGSRVSRASRDLPVKQQAARDRGFVLCVPVFFSLSFSVP